MLECHIGFINLYAIAYSCLFKMVPIAKFSRIVVALSMAIVASCSIFVLAQVRDFKLASNLGREIRDNEANLTYQEIIFKLRRIKDGMRRLFMQDVPWKVAKGLDRALILNTFALIKLTEVSSERCYQPKLEVNQENVHKHNYLELADICRQVYKSENLQNFIEQHASAQFKICSNAMGFHIRKIWEKIVYIQPTAATFKRLLLSNFPPNKELDELTAEEKVTATLGFLKQFSNVDAESAPEHKLTRAYNQRFREACREFVLNPMYTIMMTYEETGRKAAFLERHHGDLIRLHDLCSHLPKYIVKVKSIGTFRSTAVRERAKPASSAGEYKRDMDKKLLLQENRRLRKQLKEMIRKNEMQFLGLNSGQSQSNSNLNRDSLDQSPSLLFAIAGSSNLDADHAISETFGDYNAKSGTNQGET